MTACQRYPVQPTPDDITLGLQAEIDEDNPDDRPLCNACMEAAGRDGICDTCFEFETELDYWRGMIAFEDRDREIQIEMRA